MAYQSIIFITLILIVLALGFLLGPKLDMTVQLDEVNLPTDLDAYLKKKESRFQDITPNTEKKIVWLDKKTKQKTHFSLVYLHGFSATRQEVSPLMENLAIQLSANLYFTRLVGHGRSNDAMAEITLNGLLNDAVEALGIGNRIGERVILVGTSTGATLITWLAANRNFQQVAGMILISPNYGLKNKKSDWLMLPWAKYFIPVIEGSRYEFTPANEAQAKYWTHEYPIQALFPMMALVSLTKNTTLKNVNTPLLLFYSQRDFVVDIEVSKFVFSQLGSPRKRFVQVENTQGQHHVIAGSILSPGTTDVVNKEIMHFIEEL